VVVFLIVMNSLPVLLRWVTRPLFRVRVDEGLDSFLIEDESD